LKRISHSQKQGAIGLFERGKSNQEEGGSGRNKASLETLDHYLFAITARRRPAGGRGGGEEYMTLARKRRIPL